ncbi:MAG: MoaD/ThiS family protein [Xanthomonadales bacterium]|nr:MoaD/ThiS family protein [Xanthomonadales bacterium]NNL94076.1 MoaD/ThiS family protein [Xanthomonadales bacterium]
MKQVTVRLFAVFRDAIGVNEIDLQTGAHTAKDLYAELCRDHRGLHHEPNALVAINETISDWNDVIDDGDVILLFPPVAGG